MDDKPGNQYGDSCRGVDCRYTFPEDPGVYSDIWKSDGSWVSDLYRKGQYLADLRRNRHWIIIFIDQQDYTGRNGIRRQLVDPYPGNLSWRVEAVRSPFDGFYASWCGSSYLSCRKEDVQKVQTSVSSLFGGGLFVQYPCGRDVCMKKYMVRGSMTVEMSVLMPMILFLIMGCILAVFYFHDKNILSGTAYETAVVGSTKARDKNGVKPGELEALFHQRVKDKCILLTRTQVSVQIEKDEIEVIAGGSRRNIKVSVIRRAAITEPEKKIRNQR